MNAHASVSKPIDHTARQTCPLLFLRLSFVLLLLSGARTAAAPGDLDPSFGDGGRLIVSLDGDDPGEGGAAAVAIQRNGKIVVAGYLGSARFPAVVRLNPDGNRDGSFGTNGTTIVQDDNVVFRSLALQPDGKILVAGWPTLTFGVGLFVLHRFNIDGSIDTTFGQAGKVATPIRRHFAGAKDLALQADGGIVVAGTAFHRRTKADFAIVRYDRIGVLDLSFGRNGKRFTDFFDRADSAAAVAIQADGRIVVAGGADRRGGAEVFALARYRADGTLDRSFGTGGKVVTRSLSAFPGATDLVIQPDGKLVTVGPAVRGKNEFQEVAAVARYKKNGRLDPTFSGDGRAFVARGEPSTVALQADGKILVGGGDLFITAGADGFTLARLRENGRLDRRFGLDGRVTEIVSDSGFHEMHDIAVQRNGRIVAVGRATTFSGKSFFVVLRFFGPLVPNAHLAEGRAKLGRHVVIPVGSRAS